MTTETIERDDEDQGISAGKVVLIVLATIVITVGLTWWFLAGYLFKKEFTPVQLKPPEVQVLNAKLRSVGIEPEETEFDAQGNLRPEAYSEAGASRDVAFTERELNGMLAKNSDLSKKLAFDMSQDLLSAKLLVPLDEDFPVMGGKTLRLKAGVELAYRNSRPIVVLKGVSVMGVPVPNAWLGNLKNVDLINEFGADEGFWKAFADGVDNIHVADGELNIKLKE